MKDAIPKSVMTEVVAEVSFIGEDGHETVLATRGDLSAAFDVVKDDSNWKNPIDKRIADPGPLGRALIAEAVSFFAGCTAHFVHPHDDTVNVIAKGYYLSIGA